VGRGEGEVAAARVLALGLGEKFILGRSVDSAVRGAQPLDGLSGVFWSWLDLSRPLLSLQQL